MRGHGVFLNGIFYALLACLISLPSAIAQNSIPLGSNVTGDEIPTAPQSRILDQAGVLDVDKEKKAQVSARLKALYEEHDLPVYLVLYSSLVSESLGDYPRDIYDAWIGEENDGVIAVVEVDSRVVEIAFPVGAETNSGKRRLTMTRLPDYLLVSLRTALKAETEGIQGQVEYVDRFSEVLTRELDALLDGDGRSSGTGQFVMVILMIGLAIGVLGYLCHRYTRRAEIRLHEQYFLPEVEVAPRLGAQYGGSRVNTISYRSHRESEASKDV